MSGQSFLVYGIPIDLENKTVEENLIALLLKQEVFQNNHLVDVHEASIPRENERVFFVKFASLIDGFPGKLCLYLKVGQLRAVPVMINQCPTEFVETLSQQTKHAKNTGQTELTVPTHTSPTAQSNCLCGADVNCFIIGSAVVFTENPVQPAEYEEFKNRIQTQTTGRCGDAPTAHYEPHKMVLPTSQMPQQTPVLPSRPLQGHQHHDQWQQLKEEQQRKDWQQQLQQNPGYYTGSDSGKRGVEQPMMPQNRDETTYQSPPQYGPYGDITAQYQRQHPPQQQFKKYGQYPRMQCPGNLNPQYQQQDLWHRQQPPVSMPPIQNYGPQYGYSMPTGTSSDSQAGIPPLQFQNRDYGASQKTSNTPFNANAPHLVQMQNPQEIASPSVENGAMTNTSKANVGSIKARKTESTAAETRHLKATTKTDDSGQDETDAEGKSSSTIEVTGFSSTMDEETLLLYFENRKRSGGGDITNSYMKAGNKLVITYDDPEVAERVENREHTLSDSILRVRKAIVLPLDKRSFILEGLPEATTKEDLELYVENRTEIETDPKFYFGESCGLVLIRYNEDIQDFDTIATRIAKRTYKGASLTAKQVMVTNAILVRGFPRDISDDILQLYFESPKNGGGDVSEVKIDSNKNTALVYFKNYKVVDSVLGRQHKIQKSSLDVQPYHECIGYVLSEDAPPPPMPETLSRTVKPNIASFITTHPTILEDLQKRLSHVHAKVTFQDDDEPFGGVLIQHTISAGTPKAHDIAKSWTKNVQEVLVEFLKQFDTECIEVPEGIWLMVTSQLVDIRVGDVNPIMDEESSTITFTGKVEHVRLLKQKIESVVKDVEAEIDKQRHTVTVAHNLDALKVRQLMMCKFSRRVAKDFPDIVLQMDAKSSEITFTGQRSEATAAKLLMFETLDNLKKIKHATSPFLSRFLTSQQVSNEIYRSYKQEHIEATYYLEGDTITVSGINDEDTRKALDILTSSTSDETIHISHASKAALDHRGWDILLRNLQEENIASIDVSRSPAAVAVRVITFQSHMKAIKDQLQNFIKLHTISDEALETQNGRFRFISEFKNESLQALKKGRLQAVNIDVTKTGMSCQVVLMGTEDDVQDAMKKLRTLLGSVISMYHRIDEPGMAKLFVVERGNRYLESVGREFKCIIEVDDGSTDVVDDKRMETTKYSDTRQGDTYDSIGASSVHGYHPQPSSPSVFRTSEGMHIRLVKGDISSQKADVIVNTIHSSCDLTTGVISQAILKAAGQHIQAEINIKKAHDVNEGDLIVTGGGTQGCKQIYHICVLGTHWDGGATAEPVSTLWIIGEERPSGYEN
ncbi:protein mono-ADP-ribosyltransferase PARP14-like [Glandiceps talaboti]